eukprot:s951_g33.t1
MAEVGRHLSLAFGKLFEGAMSSALQNGNGRPSPCPRHALATGLDVACAKCDRCVDPRFLSLEAGHVSCTGMDGRVANWEETQDALLDLDFALALRFLLDGALTWKGCGRLVGSEV